MINDKNYYKEFIKLPGVLKRVKDWSFKIKLCVQIKTKR